MLEALAELPGERVLEALEEAAERRIVEEEPGAPGRYTFAHALIRETLYASLSGPRRVALHRRIGAILEQRHAGDPEPPLGELAYHFVAGRRARSGGQGRRLLGPRGRGGRSRRWRTRRLPAISSAR